MVRRQISYGAERGVPWGVSESAFNARDLEFTYQYSNFGVPGLGLKRGLGQDVVVAPYATGLAAMVDPAAAARNYGRLMSVGGRGRYGWYEALDYTPSRVPEGEEVAIVRAYMAHHQGMTVVAIANALQDGIMRARFHAEPMVQATELLLQERPSRDIVVARPRADEVKAAARIRELIPPMLRRFRSPHGAVPRTHLLSNGRYSVMVTNAGAGYSRWRDLAVTRWREDVTRDPWGSFVFLRDTGSGEMWSAGYQPSGREAASYDVTFSEDRVEFVRRDGTITTTTVIAVSPEDDAEVRRISIANQGHFPREIELTSYAELVLAPQASDVAHPAFSKLSVQTEFVAEAGTLLATRRRRSPEETEVWAAHLAVVEGETVGEMQFETDRARFIGRGHGLRSLAIHECQPGALQYDRHGARPGLQPAPPRPGPAGNDGPCRLLDRGRPDAARSPRSGGPASSAHGLRPRRDPGLDPGAGPASPSRHLGRRGPCLPAHRQSGPLCRSDLAAVIGHVAAQSLRPVDPVAPRHLRRSAHRSRADRRGRRYGDRPPALPRP